VVVIAVALLYRCAVLVRRSTIAAALFMLFCVGVMLAWVWRSA
jgi:hypothetical protein